MFLDKLCMFSIHKAPKRYPSLVLKADDETGCCAILLFYSQIKKHLKMIAGQKKTKTFWCWNHAFIKRLGQISSGLLHHVFCRKIETQMVPAGCCFNRTCLKIWIEPFSHLESIFSYLITVRVTIGTNFPSSLSWLCYYNRIDK